MKRTVRFLISFFLFAICYLLFAIVPARAQNQYFAPNHNPDVPQNMHTFVQTVTIEAISAMVCQLFGVDPINRQQACLGYDPKSGKIGFVKNGGGAIGLMGNMIAVLYTPPIHTSHYFNYLTSNFGIAKPVYAQTSTKCKSGYGFCGLQPIMPLWVTFRNIVYLIFILVFIVIGIAIMLRIKIDPRTVMSIENQIPKIIIGLILVTFSFAIAGFLIDLMYVIIYLMFNVVMSSVPSAATKINEVQANFYYSNPIGFVNNLAPNGIIGIAGDTSGAVKDIVAKLFMETNPPVQPSWIGKGELFDFMGNLGTLIGDRFSKFITDVLSQFLSWLAMVFAFLIIGAAILFSLFRLWFALLMAYIYILIDIVLAPFWILSGLIPGGGPGFSGWLRDLGANLIAFPTAIFLFLLGVAFMTNPAMQDADAIIFVPPLIGNLAGAANGISALIGLGIILLTPQVVNMAKEAVKAPQFKYGSAFGQALGQGAGFITGTAKSTIGTYFQSRETRLGHTPSGKPEYSNVGLPRAIVSRFIK